MKRFLLFLLAGFFTANMVMAQAPVVPAAKGTTFGEKVTAENAQSADMLATFLNGKDSAEVKVQAKVLSVCKARGCFIYIKTAKGKIYVKTKDDAFFVPMALNGKTVVVQGMAQKDKESKEISIQATGILVM